MTVIRLVASSIIFATVICDTRYHRRTGFFETKETEIVCPTEYAIFM